MKISKILSASVLAGAVLFSGTACSAQSSNKAPEPSASTQAQPSETSTAAAAPATSSAADETAAVDSPASDAPVLDERAEAARTVTDFYAYVSDPDNSKKIQEAGAPLKGRGASATDAELKTLVDALPLGFQYFDTSSPDLIKNAYVQLLMGASVMGSAKMELTVPADAVTVTGETATVDPAKIETVLNGNKIETPKNSSMPDLKMKKDDSGNWVMIAEDYSAKLGAGASSDGAAHEGNMTK